MEDYTIKFVHPTPKTPTDGVNKPITLVRNWDTKTFFFNYRFNKLS